MDWLDHRLKFATDEHLSPEYLLINPNGVVPSLIHDGGIVIDSSVINEYLEDVFPEYPLRPANKIELAHMRAWRQYIDEVPTPSIRYPSFNAYFVPWFAKMSEDEFQAYANRRPLRRDFYIKLGRTGFSGDEIEAALQRLRDTLERMELALEKTLWLANDMFTLADISIMATMVRMEDLGLDDMWSGLPRVTSWYERIRQRPAFSKAYYPGTRELGPAC
jgi:glutathione S-transferase